MSDTLALTFRQYRLERRLFWRNPSAAFFNLGLPLLFLIAFGVIFHGNEKELHVIVPGIAGMSVMSGTFVALGHNMVALREQGVLKRMRGTPLPSGAYLGGLALNAVANTVIQILFVLIAGRLLFGIDSIKDVPELVVFLVLGVACFSALGVAFAHVIPNSESAPAYINAVFLPVILVSGVFYDSADAPSFIKDIAQILPLTHLIDGLTGALVKGTTLGDNAGHLAVVAVWTVFGTFFAIRGFTWESRRS
ncbi:MAG: type transporter [Solirubrobacterales bacterium]|jgi:ABC-2 type transport system permease protein|nr:type transporter [Solirubrobacterales bacterium]